MGFIQHRHTKSNTHRRITTGIHKGHRSSLDSHTNYTHTHTLKNPDFN